MSREVLLTLLGTLLVVNIGVLISIGVLSRRRRVSPAPDNPSVAVAEEATAASAATTRLPNPAPLALASDRDIEAAASSVTPGSHVSIGTAPRLLVAKPVVSAVASSLPASVGHAVVIEDPPARVGLAIVEADPEEPSVAKNGNVSHDVSPLARAADVRAGSTNGGPRSSARAAAGAQAPTSANGKRRRSRRFVLPPLEDDNDRSARAIEAFLGEASATQPLAHPERLHRRRHRARRAPGARATRTSLIVELVGYEELAATAGHPQATRLAGALAEALWRSARIGDEVRELTPGRIQLVLDCDPAGADAFAERASAIVKPWLSAMPVQVEARITHVAGETSFGVPSPGS